MTEPTPDANRLARAHSLVSDCLRGLAVQPSATRVAYLHVEIGRQCEEVLSEREQAEHHYAAAVAAVPGHRPALQALARAPLRDGPRVTSGGCRERPEVTRSFSTLDAASRHSEGRRFMCPGQETNDAGGNLQARSTPD